MGITTGVSLELKMLYSVLVVLWSCMIMFLIIIWRICKVLYLEPREIRVKLERQGIKGPPPSFLRGNIPEMKRIIISSSMAAATANPSPVNNGTSPQLGFSSSSIFPYFAQWAKQYGSTFMFALGNTQVLYVADTKMVKEIHLSKTLDLGKPSYLQKDRGALLGKGLITSNGALWLHQRKTIVPQLFIDKVKDNFDIMVESAHKLVSSWQGLIETGGGIADIKVDDYVRSFTSAVISKMMFGSHHSDKSVALFPKCRALMKALQSPTILRGIPLFRYLPTKENREAWRLEKELYETFIHIVKENHEDDHECDKMSKIIMESAKTGELGSLTSDEYIVDNCKDLYLAGFEVTAMSILWGLVLLASNPEWQARLRAEVLEICGGRVPDANMLSKMKLMKMVIQEVLRLAPGVALTSRQALKDVKVGDILVPKGVNIWMWTPAIHQDLDLWGPDADRFNPDRFANGILGASKSPNAYIPFGVGIRTCPGQYLAITKMKMFFSIVLSHFCLSISPNYRHSPRLNLLLEPEFGVNLIVSKV